MPSELFPRPFGVYTLLEPLAQGGMGALYLAYRGEAGMEKLCVVKTVLRELADKEYLARFRDEAKVVVRLSHGNLVPVFDAGTVLGELYVAMEHVDGKDLRAVWNRCAKKGIAFPVDVAVHLVRELARGLHHAHTIGNLQLVHRDVSPPNVLLAFSGEVKLTDFGLASSTLKIEKTAPGVIYGKVSYMAPEQARGEELDSRTDLYAAGVILWELLTGRQLFPSTDADVLGKVRDPRIDPPSARASRVSKELDAIVLRALAPERVDRYPDCESFRVALAEYLAREAPATDGARVAAFLRELFDDEIEADRKRRDKLIAESRFATPATTRIVAERPTRASEDGPSGAEGSVDVAIEVNRSGGILGALIDGRYKISRLIGEGGMGRVYEAEHIEIGKRVAVKVLHPRYTTSPEAVARFRREARAASRVGHPNIVDVTDSGTTLDGAVYFVMEYLEGCDLSAVIAREGALAKERAVHIAVQMARAIHAAHQAKVIHRDLKPENIYLVARSGQPDFVKVLDFGIARQVELDDDIQPGGPKRKLTNPGMAMGTPEYMAPEQASGQPADARSDVYALGAILYEMLTGQPPHTGNNFMEVLSRKANEVPQPLTKLRSDVGRDLSDLVARALSKDPLLRPQSMEDLAQGLEHCRPDRRSRGERGGDLSTGRIIEPARQPVVRYAAIGAAALLAIGAGALAVVKLANRQPAPLPLAALQDPPREATPPKHDPAPAQKAPPTVAAVEKPAPPHPQPAAPPRPAAPERVAVARRRAAPPAPRPEPPAHPAAVKRSTLDEARKLLDERQLPAAERAFTQLLGSPVERGPAATGLAKCAFERGEYAEAIRRGERAIKLGGGAAAHLVLGDSYFKVLKYDAAVREYREVLKVSPGSSEAKQHLEAAQRKMSGG